MNQLKALAAGCVGLATMAHARVGTIDIGELRQLSSLVVLGHISSVKEIDGVKVAMIKPQKFLKGQATGPIAFVAEPTWTCDMSTAVSGERVLLYLSPLTTTGSFAKTKAGDNMVKASDACRKRGMQLLALSHSGRGRIPLLRVGAMWVAEVKTYPKMAPQLDVNLSLPKSAPVMKLPNGGTYVTLEYLVSQIHQRVINRTFIGGQ